MPTTTNCLTTAKKKRKRIEVFLSPRPFRGVKHREAAFFIPASIDPTLRAQTFTPKESGA